MMNLVTLHIVYTTRHVKKFNMAVAGSMHILCGTEVTTIEREKMQPSFNLQQGNIYICTSSFFFFLTARVSREGEGMYVDYNWRHAFDGKKDCASDCPQVTCF